MQGNALTLSTFCTLRTPSSFVEGEIVMVFDVLFVPLVGAVLVPSSERHQRE